MINSNRDIRIIKQQADVHMPETTKISSFVDKTIRKIDNKIKKEMELAKQRDEHWKKKSLKRFIKN